MGGVSCCSSTECHAVQTLCCVCRTRQPYFFRSMPAFLAVDWDGIEARFVFAQLSKDKINVRSVGSTSFVKPKTAEMTETDTEEESPPVVFGPAEIGSTLHHLLRTHHVGTGKTLFGLSASTTDLMLFTLPPAKQEEIPEILKNQAIRELPGFLETNPIDYLTLNAVPGEPQKVLAVSLNRTQQKNLQTIGKSARRKPNRLEIRGIAAAELLLNSGFYDDAPVPRLLVNILCDELDLVLLVDKKVVNFRSVKLPEMTDSGDRVKRINSEIARTLAVGLPTFTEDVLEHICLFGGTEEWTDLVEKLQSQSLQVQVVNPFHLKNIRVQDMPDCPGRYAGLLGMFSCEVLNRTPAIDLLHPKSTPTPPNYIGMAAIALLGLGILLGCLYFWNNHALKRLESEKVDKQRAYEQVVAQYNQLYNPWIVLSNAQRIDQQDVNWLDTFRDITSLFPDQQDMVITQLRCISGPINPNRFGSYYSGQINITALVRDVNVVQQLKTSLESRRFYTVMLGNPSHNPTGGGYPWTYNISIACIKRPDTSSYLLPLPDEIRAASNQYPEFYQQMYLQHQQQPVQQPTTE